MRVGVIIIALLWCAWIAMLPLCWLVWADSKDVTIPLETKVEQAVEAANRENQFVVVGEEPAATNKIVTTQIEEFLNYVPEGKDIFVSTEKTDGKTVAKVYSAFSENENVLYQYQELHTYQGWEVANYDANQVTFHWDNYNAIWGATVGWAFGFLIPSTVTWEYRESLSEKKPASGVKLVEPPKDAPTPDIWGEEYQIPKKKEEKETITDPFEQKAVEVGR